MLCGQKDACCVVKRMRVVWSEGCVLCGQKNACCVFKRMRVACMWSNGCVLCGQKEACSVVKKRHLVKRRRVVWSNRGVI